MAVTTEQRITLQNAVTDYLEAGANRIEVEDDVEEFVSDWLDDQED